jgi:hypothetical protein
MNSSTVLIRSDALGRRRRFLGETQLGVGGRCGLDRVRDRRRTVSVAACSTVSSDETAVEYDRGELRVSGLLEPPRLLRQEHVAEQLGNASARRRAFIPQHLRPGGPDS